MQFVIYKKFLSFFSIHMTYFASQLFNVINSQVLKPRYFSKNVTMEVPQEIIVESPMLKCKKAKVIQARVNETLWFKRT